MEKIFFILLCAFSFFVFVYPMIATFKNYLDYAEHDRNAEKESEDIEIHVGEDVYYMSIPKPITIRKKKKS